MNARVSIERVQTLGSYGAIVRRRWPILVAVIPPAILLAVFLAYTLPATYQSSATILLEPSSIPPELVKTTVVSYADQQIEIVQRTVMTTDRLTPVVAKIDPYPDEPGLSARDKARKIIGDTSLQKVDPVTLEPLVMSSAFSIFYDNPDPQIAAKITGEIAELFLTYNRETRTAAAKDAHDFLAQRAKQLDEQIREIDNKISDFKAKYGDALPESRLRNEGAVDRGQREIDSTEAQIRIVEQQESLLKLQLSQTSPNLAATGTDIYTQLAQLRAELAAAQQKYTPDHPDVKRLTRAIEALAAQARLGTGEIVRADNPEYLRVASELDATRRNLAALRASVQRARSQIADYELRLSRAPTVERDYVQLERDKEATRVQFADIQAKLREAEIAQSLESESKGERYTLIRSPGVPSKPFSPNRLGILMLGVLLGSVAAIAIVIIRESSDPTVRNVDDITDLSDLPLIGAIPTLITNADRRRQRLIWGSVGGIYVLATVGVALSVIGAA
jgi:polysaccharide chain length determinant protein (PEP-CTERM system associated)